MIIHSYRKRFSITVLGKVHVILDRPQIKDMLNEQKFRLTSEREFLLDLFSSSSFMLTPGQLYELAKKK